MGLIDFFLGRSRKDLDMWFFPMIGERPVRVLESGMLPYVPASKSIEKLEVFLRDAKIPHDRVCKDELQKLTRLLVPGTVVLINPEFHKA